MDPIAGENQAIKPNQKQNQPKRADKLQSRLRFAVMAERTANRRALSFNSCAYYYSGVLNENSSCSLNITFTPSVAGVETATLNFKRQRRQPTPSCSRAWPGCHERTGRYYPIQSYGAETVGTTSTAGGLVNHSRIKRATLEFAWLQDVFVERLFSGIRIDRRLGVGPDSH